MNFQTLLQTELAQRRQRNPRYSLRAFARDMGTNHSTLSQLLRGRRTLSTRTVQKFGRRLGLPSAQIADACLQQHAETILRFASSPSFRPDSRWIATQTGVPLDAVNVALQRLLYHGDLVMKSSQRWFPTRTPHA